MMKAPILFLIAFLSTANCNAQTERLDSLIGSWAITKVQYKFSKKPIIFTEQFQEKILVEKAGAMYNVVFIPVGGNFIMSSLIPKTAEDILRGISNYNNISIIAISDNEISFTAEKDGRPCTATLLRSQDE